MTIPIIQDLMPDNSKAWRGRGLSKYSRIGCDVHAATGGSIEFSHCATTFRLVVAEATTLAKRQLVIDAQIGEDELTLCIEPDFIQEILGIAGFSQDISQIDSRHLALIIEHLFAPIFARLNDTKPADFVVLSVEEQALIPPLNGLSLRIEWSDTKGANVSICNATAAIRRCLQRYENDLSQKSKGKEPNDFSLNARVSFRTTTFPFSLTDYAELTPGDAILLPAQLNPPMVERLVVESAVGLETEQDVDGLKVTRKYEYLADDLSKLEKQLSDNPEIPLEISLQLAKKKVSVKLLQKLSVGDMIPFKQKIGEPVDILLHEDVMASGELIEIEGCFGIKISKIN